MGSGVPEIILTEIIIAVAECIRGYPDSQKDFQILEAPLNPPRPAMVVLLMSMVNSKARINGVEYQLYMEVAFPRRGCALLATTCAAAAAAPHTYQSYYLYESHPK